MINYDEVQKFFYDNYYVSNEKLNYYTLLGINLIKESKIREGQDIYAICLDGAPGAGKSLYAKMYAQMVHEILKTEVSFISYQCDDATSKLELFEDINVGAAVAGKSEEVNIPGVLARAVQEANKGKKVILFIDEYDKSREQVDSLFLQFLQDGRINTNQFGDLQIKDEYKGNIQVLFAKNDFRTELTGPLMRRLRRIKLNIIKPSDFMELANRKFIAEDNEQIVRPIVNLISLVYEKIYDKDDFTRLPATSEMFGAIEDIIELNSHNAPGSIVYEMIIEDLFKNEDDRELFSSMVEDHNNKVLNNLLLPLKNNNSSKEKVVATVYNNILQIFTKEAEKELEKTKKELENKIAEAQQMTFNMEKEKETNSKKLEEELAKFEVFVNTTKEQLGQMILQKGVEKQRDELYAQNFQDSNPLIRRGKSAFLEGYNWNEIASLVMNKNEFSIEKLIEVFLKDQITIYENGFYKEYEITSNNENKSFSIILVRDKSEFETINFHVFSDCKNCLEDDRFKEIITNLFGKIIHLNNSDNYTVYFDGKESKRIDDYSEDEEISENILSLIKGGIND